MSRVREEKKVIATNTCYKFYCDDCGKLIMTSWEYDDGYYATPDKFTVYGNEIKGDYCKECGTKRLNEIKAYLDKALDPHSKKKEDNR